MNDNDIIKALEWCAVSSSIETCGECPYAECPTRKGCVGEMVKDALDLINRQKAEIERLQKEKDFELYEKTRYCLFWKGLQEENQKLHKICDKAIKTYKETKSEAIKEFAEKLKEETTVDDDSTWWVANIDIDNLVKEMTENDFKE